MAARTERPGTRHATRRLLIVSGALSAELPAERVTAALARGIERAGGPAPESIALAPEEPADAKELLDALDFDRRMRAAHAVVIGDAHLAEHTLAASVTFEIATRARQAGVPAYAVTANNELDAFDARLLDLQVIIEARTVRALGVAGGRLAKLV